MNMKKIVLAGTAIACLAAGPALAQSNGDSGSNNGGKAMSKADMVASQDKILKMLDKAGYSDSKVMDAAYMVQTTTPDGEQVIMMVDTSGRVLGARPQSGQSNDGQSKSDDSDGSSN
ncbi:hypothetical protein [Pararhizobium mangrovi]|uniref:PepSY domain-containing protein n=1 Tax=Pararhizobium mangrovi TaxID=2590452 RepID=A0A506U4M1_9HYPH|nr:hypothetical protein [Pararhizobium mangrovi]TPW29323.1 hypothetical protein FJU11_07900 [Pararhizobium mangrovi]